MKAYFNFFFQVISGLQCLIIVFSGDLERIYIKNKFVYGSAVQSKIPYKYFIIVIAHSVPLPLNQQTPPSPNGRCATSYFQLPLTSFVRVWKLSGHISRPTIRKLKSCRCHPDGDDLVLESCGPLPVTNWSLTWDNVTGRYRIDHARRV